VSERRSSYLNQTNAPPLLVTDAICHGQLGDRTCGADLARYVERACNGEPLSTAIVTCPVCRNQVTISLSWQPALLCASPVLLAESVH
jgi:hypothetical protein